MKGITFPMLPSDFPSNPAVGLLNKLCIRHDRAKANARKPTLRIDFPNASGFELEVAEKILLHAEKIGAIEIDRPRQTPHILKRVRLADNQRLCKLLGRTPAAIKANAILEAVAPLIDGASSWIEDAIETGLQKWNRGARAFRIEADQIDRIIDFTKLLIAIDEGVDGRDIRTFSSEAGVSSKAFEKHKGSIIKIVRESFGWEGEGEEEVLTRLGFKPFFQQIQISGPISIPSMGLDATHTNPSVGIPPLSANQMKLTQSIDALLTIENLTSFNRHTRDIRQPNVVVIYSGGFPSRPVIEAIKTIAAQAPNARLYHWGDIDVGGIRIFRNIEQRLGQHIVAHLMSPEIAELYGKQAKPNSYLAKLADTQSGAAELANYLAAGNPKHLEQELVPPEPIFVPTECVHKTAIPR